jgi:uncharacterized protein YjbJ (UPF0337 family)
MINSTEINENWQEIKGKLKKKFAKLSDFDLLIIEGRQDEVLYRLQVRLGKTKAEVIKLILGL